MNPIRAALATLFLTATLAHAGPLSNEDLLALRTAERIAALQANLPSGSGLRQMRIAEAWELMTPILDRPLPAGRQVWISLGRLAAAASDAPGGAVVLAGLRREVPDFMSNDTLADIAVSLNANTKAREMAEAATTRLEAGDNPAQAIEYLRNVLSYRTLLSSLEGSPFQYAVVSAAVFDGLAAALDRAELADLAEQARKLAEQQFDRIIDPADQALALIYTAEGRILFGDRMTAVTKLQRATKLAETLPEGAEVDRLWTDIARLRARTGDIEGAVTLAAVLDPEQASRIHYEVVRFRLADGHIDGAELASRAITEPLFQGLATVAIVKKLASQGRIGEAEELVFTMKDTALQAEAFAMVALHHPQHRMNVSGWLNLISAARPGSHRTAAMARIVAAYPTGHPDTRLLQRMMNDEFYGFRDTNGRSLLLLDTARMAAERGSREVGTLMIQLRMGSSEAETVNMYGLFAQVAEELKPKPSRQR